jgi:hypothetical protein
VHMLYLLGRSAWTVLYNTLASTGVICDRDRSPAQACALAITGPPFYAVMVGQRQQAATGAVIIRKASCLCEFKRQSPSSSCTVPRTHCTGEHGQVRRRLDVMVACQMSARPRHSGHKY